MNSPDKAPSDAEISRAYTVDNKVKILEFFIFAPFSFLFERKIPPGKFEIESGNYVNVSIHL